MGLWNNPAGNTAKVIMQAHIRIFRSKLSSSKKWLGRHSLYSIFEKQLAAK